MERSVNVNGKERWLAAADFLRNCDHFSESPIEGSEAYYLFIESTIDDDFLILDNGDVAWENAARVAESIAYEER